jgi:hypothetical protein
MGYEFVTISELIALEEPEPEPEPAPEEKTGDAGEKPTAAAGQ